MKQGKCKGDADNPMGMKESGKANSPMSDRVRCHEAANPCRNDMGGEKTRVANVPWRGK